MMLFANALDKRQKAIFSTSVEHIAAEVITMVKRNNPDLGYSFII
ncbi:MAG: hypothetical protein AAFW89_10410 [Bacteroidota bacterium]